MEIAITSWQASEPDIRHIRESVFILELGIPAELEWDRHDQDSIHVLASAGEHGGIATGRLLPGEANLGAWQYWQNGAVRA